MATELSYIEYILEQLDELKNVTYKKMFGEYLVYNDSRPIILVCNNTSYVKILPETTSILKEDCSTAYPYKGAKLHYVLDVDDKTLTLAVVKKLTEITPIPKKKGKKIK